MLFMQDIGTRSLKARGGFREPTIEVSYVAVYVSKAMVVLSGMRVVLILCVSVAIPCCRVAKVGIGVRVRVCS